MSNVVAQIYKSAKQTYNKQRILQIWNMKIQIPKRIDINTHWLRKKIQKHREFLVKFVVSNNIILHATFIFDGKNNWIEVDWRVWLNLKMYEKLHPCSISRKCYLSSLKNWNMFYKHLKIYIYMMYICLDFFLRNVN